MDRYRYFLSHSGLLLLATIAIVVPSKTFALNPQNPTSLCDRFVEGPERNQCEKKMKDLSPDWYLADLCSKQFEDKSFYQCMELTKTVKVSPKKLEACDNEGFSDQSRIDCIQGTKTTAHVDEVFQTREIEKKRVAPKGSQRLSEGR